MGEFESGDELRIVVLSGAGERAFSVGQDLQELVERSAAGIAEPSSLGSHGRPG